MRDYPSKNKIIILLLIAYSTVMLTVCSCGSGHSGEKRPAAVKGVLDLRGWSFEHDGALTLNGEWEFCWNRLYGPDDFTKPDYKKDCGYTAVPGLWKGLPAVGAPIPGEGSATYRLKIISAPDKSMKMLSLQRVFSMYKLWVNGVLLDKRGAVDRSSKINEDYIFIHNVSSSSFSLNEGENEIILQVSNRKYESGGIGKALRLEDKGAAESDRFMKHTVSMVVFAMLLFASIYNIMLFFFRREERTPLYFGLLCLAMAANTINHQFPILSGSYSYPGNPYFINYLTVVLAVPFFFMTIKSIFPDEFSDAVSSFFLLLAAVFIIILLFSDFRTAEQCMKVYFVFMILLTMYIVYVFSKALINRRDDVLLFTAGFAPCLLATVNDVLYAMWIINTTNTFQYGMIVLSIVTSIVISRRFARALHTVEKLSGELTLKNISLEKIDRLKDQFLANTSHELRTPLHGMIGLSESMMEGAAGNLSPEALENLALISSSGHRLVNMVNDLLDMARIQNEGLTLNLRPVDLYPVSQTVVKLSAPLVGVKPVEIINRIGPGVPAVFADEDRIRQVLCNLVVNAVKFTNSGTVEISARVLARSDDEFDENRGKLIEVSVSDTGIGIPDEYKEKIFEQYQQVDGSDTRSYGGTGLGLAIARRIIEMHNGTIKAEDGEKRGSVFSFILPAADEPVSHERCEIIFESPQHLSPDEGHDDRDKFTEDAAPLNPGKNPVILVVDDDPVNVRILKNYLESKKYGVKTAYDGVTALDIIENDKTISLVLLDIMMPVMSGYEVCRRIRSKYPPDELPVIMLTAKNMQSDIDAAFEAGANDYLVKPFRISELLARAGTMLKLRNIRKTSAEYFTISCRNRTYTLKFSEVIHITSHAKNIVIHTPVDEIEAAVPMKDIIDRLPPDVFVRIHKRHIVNINYLHSISHVLSGRYKVRLRDDDDTELPVGSAFLDNLRKKYDIRAPFIPF